MKKKILFVFAIMAVTVASFASVGGGACDTTVCPGGSTHCCTDAAGNSFYNKSCGC